MCNKLKFLNYDIVFQEVPNEVSLMINISGCPHKCEGCHSPILQQYVGEFLLDNIKSILDIYKEDITCVCFMGGDQNQDDLINALKIVRIKYKLKTCLYSGMDKANDLKDVLQFLDYVKIGSYKKDLGGLQSKNTNQRFYDINNKMKDITYKFQEQKI